MQNRNFFLILLFLCTIHGSAQVDPEIDARLERRIHTFQQTSLPYRLFVPDQYNPAQRYPLLLFLHGARWSGSDNISQLDNEFAIYWVQDSVQALHPSFVVYPQCPSGHSWESVSGVVSDFPPDPEMDTVTDLLDSLIREFRIDERRIYIAGKSMGGLGSYGMISRNPDQFAAAVIAAGNYVYRDISDILNMPLWLLHARFDDVMPVEQSRCIIEQLEAAGRSVIFTHCNFHTDLCTRLSQSEVDQAIEEGGHSFYSEYDTSGHQIEPKVVRTYGLHQWVYQQVQTPTAVYSTGQRFPELIRCYPNPFNSQLIINYHISTRSFVEIKVFNIRGREVVKLLSEIQEEGVHYVRFDGSDLSAGIYVAHLKAGGSVRRVKMVMIK
jgi:pimeloyl-ACP methyl ester carboxylesterase